MSCFFMVSLLVNSGPLGAGPRHYRQTSRIRNNLPRARGPKCKAGPTWSPVQKKKPGWVAGLPVRDMGEREQSRWTQTISARASHPPAAREDDRCRLEAHARTDEVRGVAVD